MLCLFSQLRLTGKIPCIIFCDKGQKILWGTIFPKTKSKSICGTKASCKVNEESGNYIAALLLYCSPSQAKKKKNSPHNMFTGCLSDKKPFSETWDKCMHSILFRKPVTKLQVIGRKITNGLERSKNFFYSSLDLWCYAQAVNNSEVHFGELLIIWGL